MTITKNRDGSRLVVKLNGRLDTTTSPQLERTLLLDDIDEVIECIRQTIPIEVEKSDTSIYLSK